MRILYTILFAFLTTIIWGQTLQTGLFLESQAEYTYLYDLSLQEVQAKTDSLLADRQRIVDITTHLKDNERHYDCILVKSDKYSIVESLNGWSNFIKKKREMQKAGYLLTEVEGYATTPTEMTFIGVWTNESDTPQKVWKLDSREAIRIKTEEMTKQEFYLKEVETFTMPNNTVIFLALYHKGKFTTPRSYFYENNTLKKFQMDVLRRTKSGHRIVDIEIYTENDKEWYMGVFEKGNYGAKVLFLQEKDAFDKTWEDLEKQGLKLVDIETSKAQ